MNGCRSFVAGIRTFSCSVFPWTHSPRGKASATRRGQALGLRSPDGERHIGRFVAVWIVPAVGRSGSYLDEESDFPPGTRRSGIQVQRCGRGRGGPDPVRSDCGLAS